MDSLFAFRQEVYLEPAGRASREVYLRSQPRPPWLAWMAVGNGALCGHRGELAPNTERKAWLRGTSPWPLRRHSPLCWALGSLSRTPSLPPSVCRASLWGPPPGGCPSISRTVAPEGTSLASRTASPAAAAGPTPDVLVSHWGVRAGPRSLTPTPPPQRNPQSLLAPSRHLGRSAPCRSSQASCMLPASSPPHTGPAQPTGPLL